MLRMLIAFALGALVLISSNTVHQSALAAGPSSGGAQPAAGSTITIETFHPTGSSSVNDLLSCGWHNICIPGPDGGQALDWVPANMSNTSTWARIFAIGGGGSSTWVSRAESYYQETPCKQVRADIERISDYALYGTVHQYHSGGNPNHNYFNIFGSTAGVQNSAVTGYILPHAQDNCTSTGDHTHQFYESGPYDSWYGKDSYSLFNTCNLCMTPFGIWSTYEYAVQFVTG